jgi:DNA-binding PadR family transcriptional regulator
MDVKSMLLGFLMHSSMTGYELKKVFALSFSFFSGLSYGSIYPALRKMEQEGLITMRLEIQDGSPNRKVYTITDAGKQAFFQALKEPLHFEKQRNAFLTRLFFFAHLSQGERVASARKYLDSVKQVRGELEAARPQIELRANRYQYLCFQFGLRFFEDLAGNLSEVIGALEDPVTSHKG